METDPTAGIQYQKMHLHDLRGGTTANLIDRDRRPESVNAVLIRSRQRRKRSEEENGEAESFVGSVRGAVRFAFYLLLVGSPNVGPIMSLRFLKSSAHKNP